uniref:MARVEL domain-containing protein n=1 Tax=Plectus sambesii TaxID=2011161 RepID=A0A914XE46_9BILA
METPHWLRNHPYTIIRSLRILNMALLGASGAAVLLMNEYGYTYDIYKNEDDLITIGLVVTFTLCGLALLLFVFHWTRITIKASEDLWFFMLIACGLIAFIFFIFDIAYATVCDENDECVEIKAMVAAAVFKLLSMVVWFCDAIHVKYVSYKHY